MFDDEIEEIIEIKEIEELVLVLQVEVLKEENDSFCWQFDVYWNEVELFK